MALQCGIVGLPNVGKSSLFNALTASAAAAAENFPFCTVKPNVGVVSLADERLQQLAETASSARIVPATVQLIDIAGLVRGASQGEGLGSQFLAHIREVDGIVHVLRCFDEPDVVHVAGKIDPLEDAQIVELELALADLATVQKTQDRNIRLARSGDAQAAKIVSLCEQLESMLGKGQPARNLVPADESEASVLKQMCLITAKPMLYCANLAEHENESGKKHLQAVEQLAKQGNTKAVAVCARFEAELAGLDLAERRAFLADLNLKQSGLERLAEAAYALLGLHTFFTVGPNEAHAWQLPIGSSAHEAAGCVHSDISRGFIRAEITAWQDYISYGGESGCREAGKMRVEGRDYTIADGDVAYFRFNV